MDYLDQLHLKLRSLVIFRPLLEDTVISKLDFLLTVRGLAGFQLPDKVSAYADFVSALFAHTHSFTDYVSTAVLPQDNLYLRKYVGGDIISPVLEDCLRGELDALDELSRLSAARVRDAIGYDGYLPEWTTEQSNLAYDYMEMLKNVSTSGYGIFMRSHMFTVADGALKAVKSPDPIRLSDLKGYERERGEVAANTSALLEGKPAANVLLYGDAGTGKSSTVKALVNEYKDRGLRLIEIRKNQLTEIPSVIGGIYRSPLKFILFIDDLSFDGMDEEIGVLKAMLEGAATVKASNCAIYVTSNRRHIISERFSDRGDDELHRNETIQEQISLSERFGLSVYFSRPDKGGYISIVRQLAQQHGLEDTQSIELRAERFAMERGGRSPRAAKQFVEFLRSGG